MTADLLAVDELYSFDDVVASIFTKFQKIYIKRVDCLPLPSLLEFYGNYTFP